MNSIKQKSYEIIDLNVKYVSFTCRKAEAFEELHIARRTRAICSIIPLNPEVFIEHKRRLLIKQMQVIFGIDVYCKSFLLQEEEVKSGEKLAAFYD